jgi:predicted CXXCH cytochrome family protein
MRKIRLTVIALSVLGLATLPALAFHDAGVADCSGCHTMHNSQDGVAMNYDDAGGPGTAPGTGYPHLLLWASATDTCLECHAGDGGGYHVWSSDVDNPDPVQANRGGGDFVFLEATNINDGHAGASNPIPGYSAGHTVVSPRFGIMPDPVLTTSPGGSYPSTDLACTSCHDPHGNDAFRLLYKDGQVSDYSSGTIAWNVTLIADGIPVFGPPESDTHHNAYQYNYSGWCATCHGDFHQGWSSSLIHPTGQPMATRQIQVYNSYRGTTNCVANPPNGGPCGDGTATDAYLHWVPFEDAANTTASTAGPTASSRVVCVSCHRAHATSAPDAGRWDFNVTLLDEDGLESGSYAIPNPYDANQRSLCNKCHSQDEFDHVVAVP